MDEAAMYEQWDGENAALLDEAPLIERFYDDPATFINWWGDAIVGHDDAKSLTLMGMFRCCRRGDLSPDVRQAHLALLGAEIFKLVDGYIQEASDRGRG